MRKPTHRWTRLASAAWEDAWLERLRWVGAGLAVVGRPGSRTIRLEAYVDASGAARLVRAFGGRAVALRSLPPPGPCERVPAPVRARGRFVVYPDERRFLAHPGGIPEALWIPPGMAFGTGAHATTAAILRALCDWARERTEPFVAADLGCGTGLLAIALEKLGAARVIAIDNDASAVKAARANFARNGCRRCSVSRADVLRWRPQKPCDVIAANLFSGLLEPAAPLLAQWLNPGGVLFFSGVLGSQAADVARALTAAGLTVRPLPLRGRWTAGVARKPERNSAPQRRRRG